MTDQQNRPSADGALIAESSRFFTIVSVATLLVAGIAGVANMPTDNAENAAQVAGVNVGDDGPGHAHGDDMATDHGTDAGHGAVLAAGGVSAGSPGDHATSGGHDGAGAGNGHSPTTNQGGGGSGHGGGGGHGGHTAPADATAHDAHAGCADDHPATKALVEKVQFSLAELYPDVATLVARGYIPYFDAFVPGGYPPGGEGISHWLRPQYIEDGVVLDPLQPETVLLDGWWNPIGMMFITDPSAPSSPVYVNDDGTPCSPWHPHTDYPARFGWWFYRVVYDDAVAEGDVAFPDQTPEMMHVWAIDNPHGVYAAHDYPPQESRKAPPGPMPSYFKGGRLDDS